MSEPHFKLVDISRQTFGKYQFCTQVKSDGMWYADEDFDGGGGIGKLKPGALPSPHQDTPELTAIAKRMHEEAAASMVAKALAPMPATEKWWQLTQHPWWKFWQRP